MQNLFFYENRIMSAISRIADSIILGLLWLVCSLPIFTIGSATAAFYYTFNKCICQKTDYIWRTFFSSFKANFKQGTLIWLLVLGLTAFIIIDFRLIPLMENAGALVMIIRAALVLMLLLLVIWTLYLFAYLARFQSPIKTVLKNSALIALAHIPQSLLLLLAFAATVVGFLCLPLLNLLFPSLYMFCANKIQEKIFRKYMSAEDLAAQAQPE